MPEQDQFHIVPVRGIGLTCIPEAQLTKLKFLKKVIDKMNNQ